MKPSEEQGTFISNHYFFGGCFEKHILLAVLQGCICHSFVSSCHSIEYVQVLTLMTYMCSHYAQNNVNTQELD